MNVKVESHNRLQIVRLLNVVRLMREGVTILTQKYLNSTVKITLILFLYSALIIKWHIDVFENGSKRQSNARLMIS